MALKFFVKNKIVQNCTTKSNKSEHLYTSKSYVINMKSVRVSHSMKNAIKEYANESYDKNINQLIDYVEDYMPLVDLSDDSSVIINLEESTVDRINSFKLSNGESVDNILIRMMVMAQILNNSND